MTQKTDSQVPDPNGPPVATHGLEELARSAAIGMTSVMVLVGGAAALLALSVVARPTAGALQSQRVTWQERQQEIAAVQAEANAVAAQAGIEGDQVGREGVRGHD